MIGAQADRESRVAADRRARVAALRSFDRPVVLEAGAGTGKTAVLVARVVTWCCGAGWERARRKVLDAGGGAAPDDVAARTVRGVVAITFTEAAAAEMASRIAEALLALRQGALPIGVDAEHLPPAEETAARAGALVGVLDQLAVRTIHAFCRRLLAGYAVDAGLRPGFEVDADGQEQAAAAREALEAALPTAYGEPGDPDYEALADAQLGPGQIEEALLALLAEGAEAFDLRGDPFLAARARPFWEALRQAAGSFRSREGGRLAALKGSKALADMAVGVGDTAALLAAEVPEGPTGAADTAERVEALRSLWPEERLRKLREAARGSFGKRGADAVGEDAAALAAAARDLHGVLAHALRIDVAVLEPGRRVLAGLLETARGRLRARGIQTFGGLLRDARDLVTDHPELASRVRGEIDQLLVDEFQDTDPLQCELLAALALDGPPQERPGLFVVGDPKQSIYGWRGADLEAYHGFLEQIAAVGGEIHPLVVNYRSVPSILREVERLVAPVMHEERGWQPAFEPLVACEDRLTAGETAEAGSVFGEGRASVEHWVTAGFDPLEGEPVALSARDAIGLEARALARDLVALRERGVSLGDVAVLMRASTDFDVILGALREARLPFVVEREEHHYRRREVMDAVALVRCILDPNDAVALVASLRSSLVGVPDAALVPLWKISLPARVSALRGRSDERLAELVAEVRRVAAEVGSERDGTPQDVPGLERLAGWEEALVAFLEALDGLRLAFEQEPPDRFVEALRQRLPLEVTEAARHLGAHRLTSLDRFHRDLVEALEAHGGSAAAVAGWLRRAGASDREHREGRPRAMGDDAVHVLTLHKAKGLGFGHVYWLQTHKGRGRPDVKRTALARRAGLAEYTLFGVPTPGLRALERDRERVDALERVRLAYVAATRAKDRLVIAGVRGAEAKDVEAASSHADLLAHRADGAGRPEPGEAMRRAARDGATGWSDEDGVRWRFPGLEADTLRRVRPVEGIAGPADLRLDEERLATARARAAAHQARPFAGTASGLEAFEAPGRGDAEQGAARETGPAAELEAHRAAALAVGSAVHAALEHDRPEASASERRARAEAAIDGAMPPGLAPGDRDGARSKARALFERFLEGPLAARLAEVAAGVVGRELPVLVGPDPAATGPEAPVGCITGSIDLVYRDPADGRLVVVDYKTDDVAPGAALEARAHAYAPQGAVYVRALQEALDLPEPPRLELWFVAAGSIWTSAGSSATSV